LHELGIPGLRSSGQATVFQVTDFALLQPNPGGQTLLPQWQ
jgi:hypothetical protein